MTVNLRNLTVNSLPFTALLATILIFMDQQITAVIVNRRENKLRKGCGYHLDLLVVACLIFICSVFGLPFFVAATVLSVNHVSSLTLGGCRILCEGIIFALVCALVFYVQCENLTTFLFQFISLLSKIIQTFNNAIYLLQVEKLVLCEQLIFCFAGHLLRQSS